MGQQTFFGLSELPTEEHADAQVRTALLDLCFDRGFAALTAEDVRRRAGLSPAAFRGRYAGLEDCFFQVCAAELRRYQERAAAVAGSGEWRERLRTTVYCLHRFLNEDERRCRLTLVEARTAGGRSAFLLDRVVGSFVDLIDEGRAEPTASPDLTRATAELLGGALFNEAYLTVARRAPLPPEHEFVSGAMYLTVLPYLGEAAATAELEILAPSAQQ